MFPASSILNNKPIPFLQLKPPKPIPFPSPRNFVVFSRKFVPGKAVCRVNRVWVPNTMRALTETRVSSGGSGDEFTTPASAFEHEAFIDASSGLPPTHVAGRLHITMNSLSKWLVSAIFGAIVLVRHDAEAMWVTMGSILNVLLSLTLKQTLKQERPTSALSSGHGMPSSHAQSIFFAVVVITVSMVEWLGLNASTTILSGLVLAFASYFSWLRVSLRYHTMSQVGVGAVVGSIFSILWFWAWKAFVLKAFISFLWVRIILVLGAAGFIVGFLLHIFQHWLNDED